MILTQTALQKINNKQVRRDLTQELDVIDQVIKNYIRKNKPNGPLTTFKALEVIRKYTGLSDDQILVDEKLQKSEKSSAAVSTV